MNSLANLTANRYKIFLDESWQYERSEVRSRGRIWFETIRCKDDAFISLYSLNPLIFQLWTPRPINPKVVWEVIKDIPGVRADFHFDRGAVIYFPIEVLPTVAELAGAKRKRRLSAEHKAKLAEAGRSYRFKTKISGSNSP